MVVEKVKKRDDTYQLFESAKIEKAIYKSMQAVDNGTLSDAKVLTRLVHATLDHKLIKEPDYEWTVEAVQDVVEEQLMSSDFHNAAKAYILYRSKRNEERKRHIFRKRINLKPYEYPELLQYVDAVRHSYWIHTEFNFVGDVQHFTVAIDDVERNAIKNTMLAIAQIEISVKTFWSDLYHKMPKSEVGSVGATFAESEVRHQDAYSHLLEVLGLNADFAKIKEIPAMIGRVEYLESALQNSRSDDNQKYALTLTLFSLFVEHVSLFSQFLIMMSFNKHKNLFKGISNVVEATSKEEQIHGLFGIELINIIREENPHWFDDEFETAVIDACQAAYKAECGVLEWIFEDGELDFLSINTIKEFIKHRFNSSLTSIGYDALFETDEAELAKTEWFDDEIIATKHGDFFDKRSVNYNKKAKSITADDLF